MTTESDKKAGRILLPSYVKPLRYDLKVTPDMTAYTFDGIVSIAMATGETFSDEESKQITLHSKELLYRSAEFRVEGDSAKTVKAEEVSRVGCVTVFNNAANCFYATTSVRVGSLLAVSSFVISLFRSVST